MHKYYLKRIDMIAYILASFALATTAQSETEKCDYLKAAVGDFISIESELVEACISSSSQEQLAEVLKKAFFSRDEDVAISLVKSGVTLSIADMELIHFAAAGEMPKLIEYLLEDDPTLVNKIIKGNGTPLGFASEAGAYLAAKKLLDYGADINTGLPVVWAIQYGHLHVATMLIEEQLKRGQFTAEQSAEIVGAALMTTSNVTFLYYLLEKGFEPNQFNKDGLHVLGYAISHEDPVVGHYNWKYWVKHGADPKLFVCNLEPDRQKQMSETKTKWLSIEFNKYYKSCSG